MVSVFLTWILSAVVLVIIAIILGFAIRKGALGILIDTRGRYSLTQFQLVVWTIVIISLVSGVFFARLFLSTANPLGFDIPNELLAVLGISAGSAVTAIVIKTQKDQNPTVAAQIAASNPNDRPVFSQMFLVEEGDQADKVVDITKFQNFVITVFLVVAYIAMTTATLAATSVANLKALPGFSATFLTLLGISHAGYLIAKVPNRPGIPDGLTQQEVLNTPQGKIAVPAAAARHP